MGKQQGKGLQDSKRGTQVAVCHVAMAGITGGKTMKAVK